MSLGVILLILNRRLVLLENRPVGSEATGGIWAMGVVDPWGYQPMAYTVGATPANVRESGHMVVWD